MSKEELLNYIKLYTECDDAAISRITPILDKYTMDISQNGVMQKIKILKVVKYKEKKKPTIPLSDFAYKFGKKNAIDIDSIKKKVRTTEIVRKRNKFIRDAFENGYSLSEIGRFLNRDHSTILHAIKNSKI
jgi:chromosomal replication initiation ATPase DnaA